MFSVLCSAPVNCFHHLLFIGSGTKSYILLLIYFYYSHLAGKIYYIISPFITLLEYNKRYYLTMNMLWKAFHENQAWKNGPFVLNWSIIISLLSSFIKSVLLCWQLASLIKVSRLRNERRYILIFTQTKKLTGLF